MKCRKTALLRFSKILFDRFHRARERERKQEEEEESLSPSVKLVINEII